jgi:hypothetical protein
MNIKCICNYILLTILVALVFVLVTQQLGLSNLIDISLIGNGSMNHQSEAQDGSTKSRLVLNNATYVNYRDISEWNETNRTFSSNLDVQSGVSNLKYGGNSYSVSVKSDATGHAQTIMVTRIGNFTGSAQFKLTESGVDSYTLMDGNAKYRMRIYDSATGKHTKTLADTNLVGNYAAEVYMKIGKPAKESSDWLAFCNTVNEGLARGDVEGIPNTTRIEPVGLGSMVQNLTPKT